MTGELTVLIAFVAGLLSFLSPCVLPLIPSYLSFISGVSFQEFTAGTGDRRRIFPRTVFFVLGFSLVFVILGLAFAGPALLFSSALVWINLAAGLVVVLLGLNITFDFVSFLNRERRVQPQSRPTSAAGALLVGMAFGAGWSPCIGPILASILFLAGADGRLVQAGSLLLVYSLGLGVPFIVTGLAFKQVSGYLTRIRRHISAIRSVSGVFLIAVGLLIAFGRFQQLNSVIISGGFRLEQWSTTNVNTARFVFSLGLIALGLAHPLGRVLRKLSPLRPIGSTIALVLVAAGILQGVGVLNVGVLLGRWLMFQGI
jgi:cytochrome c-type biogenesis protein